MGARAGTLARSGTVHGEKCEADAVAAMVDDLCHDDEGAVRPVRLGLGPLERNHDEGAQKPALLGSEVKAGGTDVADIVGHWAAAIPKIGDERRHLFAGRLSLIGEQQRFEPILHLRTLRGLMQSIEWPCPGQAELRRDRGRFIWPGLPIISHQLSHFPGCGVRPGIDSYRLKYLVLDLCKRPTFQAGLDFIDCADNQLIAWLSL